MTNIFSSAADYAAKMFEAVVTFVGSFMSKSIKTSQRTFFPFQETLRAGYQPAFLRGNRPINVKHVDSLMKLLKEQGKTKFTVCGTVTPVLPLLEDMELLPEEGRLHFYNIYGEELTLNSPGVREGMYYLVLDGQHRVAACHTYGFDMDMQLVPVEGDPLDFIADYNTGGENWKGVDWVAAHRATGKYSSPLYSKMDEVGAILPGVSERYKTAILVGNFDGIKKTDAVNGVENIVYDEELANRGIGFAKAIAVAVMGNEADKRFKHAGRFLRGLDGVRAILDVTQKCQGKLLTNYDVDMKCLLGTLDADKMGAMEKEAEYKNYGRLCEFITRQYKDYADAQHDDRDVLSAEIDSRYEELAAQRATDTRAAQNLLLDGNSAHKPKRLVSGTIEEMKLNAEAIQSYTERKAAEKAGKNSH